MSCLRRLVLPIAVYFFFELLCDSELLLVFCLKWLISVMHSSMLCGHHSLSFSRLDVISGLVFLLSRLVALLASNEKLNPVALCILGNNSNSPEIRSFRLSSFLPILPSSIQLENKANEIRI